MIWVGVNPQVLSSRNYPQHSLVLITESLWFAMKQPIVLESNQNHATITDNGICPTLSASMGMGGGYVPMIAYETDNTDREEIFPLGRG